MEKSKDNLVYGSTWKCTQKCHSGDLRPRFTASECVFRLSLPFHKVTCRSYRLQKVCFRSSRLDGYANRTWLCIISLMTFGMVVGTSMGQAFAREPLALNAPQAASSEPITSLKPEKVIGHGTLDGLDWSPDGGKLAIASSLGLYLYDPLSLKEADHVDSTNWIRWVNFSSSGDKLATVDPGGVVSIWNLENQPYPILNTNVLVNAGLPIRTLAFRDDLSVLAVGYGEASVELFDLERDQILAWINLPDYPDTRQIESLAFSPDGKQLAVDAGYDIFLIDASSGAIKRILPSDHDIHHLTFSPAGPWLAADNAIYSLKDGSRVQAFRKFNPASIQAIAYSPDGQVLAITTGSTISLVDVHTGLVLQELVANGVNIRCLKFDPAGRKVVAATDDDRLWVWEVITGDVLQTTDAFTGPIVDVDFSPDGSLFAALTSDHIWLGDAQESAVKEILPSPAGALTHLAFNPNNLMLATAGDSLRLWNTSATILHQDLVGHTARISAIAFSPEGSYLATAANDHTVRIWSTGTSVMVNGNNFSRTLEADLPADIDFLAFSPDGSRLAGGSRHSSLVYIWDARNGLPLLTLNGPVGGLTSLQFSPDSSLLAVSGIGYRRMNNPLDPYRRSNAAYVWNVKTGKLVVSLGASGSGAHFIRFSRDDQFILCDCLDDSQALGLWKMSGSEENNHAPLQTLPPIQPADSTEVTSVLFGPDSKLLAVALASGRIEIWGIENRILLYNLIGHRGEINTMAFRPDGKMLLTGGQDGILAFWNLQ